MSEVQCIPADPTEPGKDEVVCRCRVFDDDGRDFGVVVQSSRTAASAWEDDFCPDGAVAAVQLALERPPAGKVGRPRPLQDGWTLRVGFVEELRAVEVFDEQDQPVGVVSQPLAGPPIPNLRGEPCPDCQLPLQPSPGGHGWECASGHRWGALVDIQGRISGSPGVKLHRLK